jgi:anti-sigma-K factor RskA
VSAPGHDRFRDATASYLLGALPADEYEEFAAHLETCPECRAEVDALRPAADALPASAPQVSAPPAVASRVMAEVRREAALLSATGSEADRPAPAPEPSRRAWWRWPAPALVTAALLLGIAVGLGAAGVIGSRGNETIPLAASGRAEGANVRLVMQHGRATLEAEHLAGPGAGRVYQVWLQPVGGTPQPTRSLFEPRSDGTASVAVPPSVKDMKALLVTSEPDGGSPAPTTTPVLVATMS